MLNIFHGLFRSDDTFGVAFLNKFYNLFAVNIRQKKEERENGKIQDELEKIAVSSQSASKEQ